MKFITDSLERFPAIYGQSPKVGLSTKYTFVPTHTIVDLFENAGWEAYSISQRKARNPENKMFAKHLVRLRPDNWKDYPGVHPQMILVNSHDGSSSIQLRAGLFRLVCSNGLVIGTNFSTPIVLRHTHISQERVFEVVADFKQQVIKAVEVIPEWSNLSLDEESDYNFRSQAARLRFEEPTQEVIMSLGVVRRSEDKGQDLWTRYNVVQENLMMGGFRNGRRNVRGIKSIEKDIGLNSQLWNLASNFAY